MTRALDPTVSVFLYLVACKYMRATADATSFSMARDLLAKAGPHIFALSLFECQKGKCDMLYEINVKAQRAAEEALEYMSAFIQHSTYDTGVIPGLRRFCCILLRRQHQAIMWMARLVASPFSLNARAQSLQLSLPRRSFQLFLHHRDDVSHLSFATTAQSAGTLAKKESRGSEEEVVLAVASLAETLGVDMRGLQELVAGKEDAVLAVAVFAKRAAFECRQWKMCGIGGQRDLRRSLGRADGLRWASVSVSKRSIFQSGAIRRLWLIRSFSYLSSYLKCASCWVCGLHHC